MKVPLNNETVVCVFSVVFGAFAASWRVQKLQGMAKRSQKHVKIQTKLLTRNNKQWVIVGENWIKVKLSQVPLLLGQYQPALDLLMSLKFFLRNLKCCFLCAQTRNVLMYF